MNVRPQDVVSGGLSAPDLIQIANLTLDLRQEELRDRTGARVDLRHRSFDVLRHLVTNAGRVVSKDELLATNWPGLTVTEDSLTQCISDIRRQLGESGRDVIRTVARRGYMIILPEHTARAARDFSGGPTVAIWPFETNASDHELGTFADGLTQQMVSALGRFGELRVLARNLTKSYKDRFVSAADFGRALGVDYFVEGNLRQGGELTRVDIHLSDARTGAQVWSKTFKVNMTVSNLLAIQDEISGQASAMIGSYWGAIGAAEYKRIQNKSSAELTPYECIVQGVALGMETCMTLGMLTPEQAQQLADAGLDYYNHNIDTSERHYGSVVHTRTFGDRLETLQHVQDAGMKVCCGGILGLGEAPLDRAEMLRTLANLLEHPESVPINMLIPIEGTPLAKADPIDPISFVRTVALARILMPRSDVRLSAGRTAMTDEMQALCFMAGANSIFIGDTLLTATNPSEDKDHQLLRRLGMERSEARTLSASA